MSHFESLNQEIQEHLKQLAKSSKLPDSEETLESLAGAWIEKKTLFEDKARESKLAELAFFGKEEGRGALILTYSGSLLTLGPLIDGTRRCEYNSIGIRTDVPPTAVEDSSVLATDIEVDEVVAFEKGPIKSSSQIYAIAVAQEALDPKEEEAMLTQLGQDLTEDFVEVNKTILN